MNKQVRRSKKMQYSSPSFTTLGDAGKGDLKTMTKGSDNSYSDSGAGMAKGGARNRPELISLPPR